MQAKRPRKYQSSNWLQGLPILERKSTWDKEHEAKKRFIEAGSGQLGSLIKILQINLDRTRAAHDLLEVTVKEHDIDMVILAEPNRKIARAKEWLTDLRGDASMISYNKEIEPNLVAQGNGFIAMGLSGLTMYSCYFSPNYSFEEFEQDVSELFKSIEAQRGDILVAGDFNAAANVWSAKSENARGRLIVDMLASSDMVVVNVGFAPTFQRGAKNSTPDITFASSSLVQKITEWEVLEEDSMSGHRYIKFIVHKNEIKPLTQPPVGWRLDKLDRNVLQSNLIDKEVNTPEELVVVATQACDRAMPRKGLRRKPPVYWWNENIREKRELCTECRRKYTRKRRKEIKRKEDLTQAKDNEVDRLRDLYKSAKLALKQAIIRSKEEQWQELCEEIDRDTWGLGYRIVAKKLRKSPPRLDMDLITSVVDVLFPSHETFCRITADDTQKVDVTVEEILIAAEGLKPKKAPGPDLIYPEVVKIVVQVIPEKIRTIIDAAFTSGNFPSAWKVATLVLLKKANKPAHDPRGYRPVCLLDSFGKLLERILLNRIEMLLPDHGGLSNQQYGFRKGRSTLMAIKKVVEAAMEARQGTHKTRKLCALICLDVKNAFNSASWKEIILELRRRKFPGYIQNLVSSYLEERFITVKDTKGGYKIIKISSGVPQGSILGPTLWNILYDGVFQLKQEQGVQLVGFADDLALVVVAKSEKSLMNIANKALGQISGWMEKKQLSLAPEKTEAIVFSGRRKLDPIKFVVQGAPVAPKEHIKYLGIWLDKSLTYKKHVEEIAKKAQKVTEALNRLMPKKGGPRASRRRVLASVAHSVILYGAPIFKEAMRVELYRKKLDTVQRRMAIGICGAYRTISTEAVLVIAGLVPIAKMVRERAILFASKDQTPLEVREGILTEWENEWRGIGKGTWTRELIKNLKRWHNRKHGEVDRWVTQALSGHGVFNTYLFAIGKAPSEKCYFCGEEDTPRHAIFECAACEDLRSVAQGVNEEVDAQSLIPRMLSCEEEWQKYAQMLRAVMIRREKKEKEEKEKAYRKDGMK